MRKIIIHISFTNAIHFKKHSQQKTLHSPKHSEDGSGHDTFLKEFYLDDTLANTCSITIVNQKQQDGSF